MDNNELSNVNRNHNTTDEPDRVRRYTSSETLKKIDERIEQSVRFYAAQPKHIVTERIEELRREWSIERYLQVNVASVGLATVFFALTGSRKWALLTCSALGFFMYHALRGFEPPLPLLRKMGIRTRGEIDREIFALKALRGDLDAIPVENKGEDFPTRELMAAVSA